MAQHDLTGISEINALLGASTEYEGKLVFRGCVRIDGRFVGEIHGDEILVLGHSADVRARVSVGTLIVHGGKLHGDVFARQLVELHAPSEVRGDIQTPQLFIEKGVVFEGQCAMGPDATEVHELDDRPEPLGSLARAVADSSRSGGEGEASRGVPRGDTESPVGDPSAADEEPFVRAPTDGE